jgi:hypothetical protein
MALFIKPVVADVLFIYFKTIFSYCFAAPNCEIDRSVAAEYL